MPAVFLLHWNEAEARERAARIRAMGYDVAFEAADGARAGRAILETQPAALVVDLSRLPSHGRETAHAIRAYKAGRTIPIVFIPGDPAKMDKVRAAVPDAAWSTWDTLESCLRQITRRPHASPPTPRPRSPVRASRRAPKKRQAPRTSRR